MLELVARDRMVHMKSHVSWPERPVAYFSMEFAVADELPIYAGGLGVLAGDTLFESSDQGRQFVGVGLFYHRGYLQQHISNTGEQTEGEYDVKAEEVGLEAVVDDEGNAVTVTVPMADRQITIQAWKKMVGATPLLLLDTHHTDNEVDDQHICDQLYAGDKEHRLRQEIVLGIGGVRMLAKLGIQPTHYHLNEAHSAFVVLEVAYGFMGRHKQTSFADALEKVRSLIVFTNHTIVPAGNDGFSEDLISVYLSGYMQQLLIAPNEFLRLGKAVDVAQFSMTQLALRYSNRINAVSRLHSTVARERWPGFDFFPITNGVYLPRWLCGSVGEVWPVGAEACTPEQLWRAHVAAKQSLLAEVKLKTQVQLREDVLTVVWARRITSYKRPRALLFEMDRLMRLLHHADKPIQVLFAGKVHPNDEEGKKFIKQMHDMCAGSVCVGRMVFVPNYDIRTAQLMVSGADVWLNTPLRGYEACGTSGMKACLNGVLQMTTRDGWTDDVDWENVGWTLDSEKVSDDIYRLLETDVAAMYYQRSRGYPSSGLSE